MQTVLQKAIAGNRNAMVKLYDATKQRVFYVAKLLLQDEDMAESATIWVYRFGWGEIKNLELETEAEFEKLMLQRVVGYCKKRTLKQNPKAFHVPVNRNFNINITYPIKDDGHSIEDSVLNLFTDLQRYIYVLHTVAKYEHIEIENVVNLKGQILKSAIDVEKKNIDTILQVMGIAGLTDYKEVTLKIIDTVNSIQVPKRVDEEVNNVIRRIVEPVEKRQKKQRNYMISVIVLVCIFLLGVGIFFSGEQGSTGGTDTETTEEIENTEGIENQNEIVTE